MQSHNPDFSEGSRGELDALKHTLFIVLLGDCSTSFYLLYLLWASWLSVHVKLFGWNDLCDVAILISFGVIFLTSMVPSHFRSWRCQVLIIQSEDSSVDANHGTDILYSYPCLRAVLI